MGIDFQKIIERHNTDCAKYDVIAAEGRPADTIPLWVADMDFQTVPEVIEELDKAVKHGIFGYPFFGESYNQAIAGWMKRHFDWEIDSKWIVKTSGVVFAIATAIRAFTKPGDAVLICQPVYHPFAHTIENLNRRLINSPLIHNDDHYDMDFADIEAKIVNEEVKMVLLCSPHNPVCRVWTREELTQLAEICKKHGILLFSDEIHSDFVYPGIKHTPVCSIDESYQDFTITATAPSKTFNLAGLQASNIFIPNEKLREAFQKANQEIAYGEPNCLGMLACRTAYEKGEEWYQGLIRALTQNRDYLKDYLAAELPEIKMTRADGTYLMWLDFRALGLSHDDLENLISNKARLWLNNGAMFGKDGDGFQRVNIACPKATLEQAMDRLKKAIRN